MRIAALKHLSPRVIRVLVACGFLVPVVILAVTTWLSYEADQSLKEDAAWVQQLLEVKEQTATLRLWLIEVENAQYGYLLTGKETYLNPLRTSDQPWELALQGLRRFAKHSPADEQQITELENLVGRRMKVIRYTMALQQAGQGAQALAILRTDTGKIMLNQVWSLLDKISGEEERILLQRQQRWRSSQDFHERLTWVLSLTALAVVLMIWALLSYIWRAQRLITMCAWTRTIQHQGKWLTFEEYMLERFGVEISHGMSDQVADGFKKQLQKQETDETKLET